MLEKFKNFFKKKTIEQELKMMNLKEIQYSEINSEIIREALKQSEKRLDAMLQIKKDINQKLFILFSGFIPILISLIAACFFIISHGTYKTLLYFLFPLTCYFFIGVMFFFLAFNSFEYGSRGTEPRFWLQSDYINGDNKVLTRLLAYLTFEYQDRINKSHNSNKKKIALRQSGIRFSLFGIITSLIFSLVQYQLHPGLYQLGIWVVLVMVFVIQALFCYRLAKRY